MNDNSICHHPGFARVARYGIGMPGIREKGQILISAELVSWGTDHALNQLSFYLEMGTVYGSLANGGSPVWGISVF